MLSNCTAELNIRNYKWTQAETHNLGPGGELIQGSGKLYYIGGIDLKTGNKTKTIYEYENEKGWNKWHYELAVPTEMRNSWSVMEIGQEFCQGTKNLTRNLNGYSAWNFTNTVNYRYYNFLEDDI